MARTIGGTKHSNKAQRYKRTNIGRSNNSKPNHKYKHASKRAKRYRGQGHP